MSACAGKILIVTHDRPLRSLLKISLKDLPYQVTVSGSPEQARIRLKQEKPDLVIADLTFPGSSGLSVIEKLRKEVSQPEPAYFAVTDRADKALILEANRNGVASIFLKPVPVKQLLSRIEAVLKKGRQAEEPESDRP